MKYLRKVMLVLVLTIMVGLIPNVYAEEISSSVMNTIPDTITISSNEKDFIKLESGKYNINDAVVSEVLEKVKTELTNGGVSLDNYDVTGSFIKGTSKIYGAYKYRVIVTDKSDASNYSEKFVKVKYADTTDTNNAAKETMQTKLEQLSLKYLSSDENNAFDESKANETFTNQLKKELNNNDIKVYFGAEKGASTPGIIGGIKSVFIYKGNEYYASGYVSFIRGQGFEAADGAVITMSKLDTDTTNDLKAKLSDKGYTNVIFAYDLDLYDYSHTGNLSLSLPIGSSYNGKEVVIFHKKHDGTFEEFTATVENGTANIEVTELSPFMVALKDSSTTATKLSNNAQTSSMNIVLLSVLAALSLVGIIYLVIRKKKVA